MMFYRMQGIFCSSIRPALTRLGPVGTRLGGLSQGAWARVLGWGAWDGRPGPGGLGLGREAWAWARGVRTDIWTYGRMYGWTAKQNIPCILQDIAPLEGRCPKTNTSTYKSY